MFRAGKWAAVVGFVGAAVWLGFSLTAQELKPTPTADAKGTDLTALRDVVTAATKRGENVDEVRKALEAFEKALPTIKSGRVSPELQALRDAVDAAAKKGENVEAVLKELAAVEVAITGRSLAKPRPEPRPELPPNPFNNPPALDLPLPVVPFPDPGRIDRDAVQKAMDLRMKALEMLKANPEAPEAMKLFMEANELMLKAMRNGDGAAVPLFPAFPDAGRVPDRARFGIRMEKLTAITTEQLGIEPNVGVAVAAVVPDSAAEKAGLRVHDIILEFAGKVVSDNTDDFVRQVSAVRAGEKVDLVVMRRGKKVEVKGVVLPDVGRQPVPPRLPVPVPGLLPVAPKLQPLPVPKLEQKFQNLQPLAPIAPLPKLESLTPPPAKPVIDGALVDIRAADEPKTTKPDLGELRAVVAAANKRGENVDTILAALTALEKALAKGAVKPGDAPAELIELRETVEQAAKKGENVEAIARELALVEKTLTGRAYERPKPPTPRREPVRPFPPRGDGFGRGVIVTNTIVTVTNGNFTIKAKQNDVAYAITGTTDATGALKIVIEDGKKTVEADDVKKVPEGYRPMVEQLLKVVNRR
ncbi:PDZ domain-containing protein [Gemmata sp. G18]|uniref:PDZ domain-containing protein n=1 Tax=Gemmata palustris TaxID=2822762 RepID=A0ABS5BWT2_9BACT|nr:PDZ domain-containing protein [Gemmata palustris]MBP3957343.1 PDZ domain-containing protein [Gemmata palustris]